MFKVFMIQDKKLSIYLMIMQILNLKIFINQSRMFQLLQRLPIALAQVKAGNNSENLLNEIRQIVYSLYQLKEIAKKVYNNIIKSI